MRKLTDRGFVGLGAGVMLALVCSFLFAADPVDPWHGLPMERSSPADHGFLCTPSDSTDLAHTSRGVMFATAGAVKVTFAGGETMVVPHVAADVVYPWRLTRIWSTSTTAVTVNDITVNW